MTRFRPTLEFIFHPAERRIRQNLTARMDNQKVPQVTIPQGSTSQFPQNNVTTVTTEPMILASNEPSLDTQPQTASDSKITDEEVIAVTQAVMQPAIQGQIVESKPKHPGGRPSKYNEGMLKKAKDYLAKCNGDVDGKPRMPFTEELAMICGVDGDTIVEWSNNGIDKEFSATYVKLKNLQKLRTLQRGWTAKNPTFAIFMLKANFGMMESEKQILVADRDVKVSITRE